MKSVTDSMMHLNRKRQIEMVIIAKKLSHCENRD